jgi:hypothetical protein
MGRNVSVLTATLQERAEAVRLQQNLQNDATGEKSNTRPGHPTAFSDAAQKDLCDRLKDLAKRRFGCTRYQVRETAFVFEEKRGLKHQ